MTGFSSLTLVSFLEDAFFDGNFLSTCDPEDFLLEDDFFSSAFILSDPVGLGPLFFDLWGFSFRLRPSSLLRDGAVGTFASLLLESA